MLLNSLKTVSKIAAVVLAIVGSFDASADAAGPGTIYEARVKPTLALVRAVVSDGTSYGTAFCISSNAGGSYFLTNHHVVYDDSAKTLSSEVSLIFPNAPTKSVPAEIVRSGAQELASEPPDLAILYVKSKPNMPSAKFSSVQALDGQSIGIAGFPAFQLTVWQSTHELEPTVAIGSVDGLNLGNYYVQYDAKTDHGNSGGPVFDTVTGYVLGVVDVGFDGSDATVDNFLAISEAQARHFIAGLSDVHMAVLTPTSSELEQRFAPARRSRRCSLASEDFSKRFAEWSHARATLRSLEIAHGRPASSRSIDIAGAQENASSEHLASEGGAFRGNGHLSVTVRAIIKDTEALDKADRSVTQQSSLSDDLLQNVRKFNAIANCV